MVEFHFLDAPIQLPIPPSTFQCHYFLNKTLAFSYPLSPVVVVFVILLSTMTRHSLSNKQKQNVHNEIAKRRERGLLFLLADISSWATTELKLSFTPSKSGPSRISRCKSLELPNNEGKRSHRQAQPEIEKCLAAWVMDQNPRGRCASGSILREKGRRLLEDVNLLLKTDKKRNLKFTPGWFWNFQKRWNVKSRKYMESPPRLTTKQF